MRMLGPLAEKLLENPIFQTLRQTTCYLLPKGKKGNENILKAD